jgi:hypothetical protein
MTPLKNAGHHVVSCRLGLEVRHTFPRLPRLACAGGSLDALQPGLRAGKRRFDANCTRFRAKATPGSRLHGAVKPSSLGSV